MIKVSGLSKQFNEILAVNNVSFESKIGEVVGFLGPNGAGKSTTMKMITGFLAPSSGKILLNDILVTDSETQFKKFVGYVPENAPLYDDLTVYEFLNFIGEMRNLDNTPSAIDKVIATCSLEEVRHQNIGTLSKGFKRRVSLAQALIHDPPILILDEPTDGLDPNQKHEVRSLIKGLAEKKCIIISTHILEEVDAICNRAIIISKGKILFDGSPEKLKQKSTHHSINDVFRAFTTNQPVEGVQL
ncbi:MAG: ABC transporter ATP-binding protein [Bdellovibrionales bacterium]|nr:ABC transporter ATP-binding protein [Bdellovibrionales bacterium]